MVYFENPLIVCYSLIQTVNSYRYMVYSHFFISYLLRQSSDNLSLCFFLLIKDSSIHYNGIVFLKFIIIQRLLFLYARPVCRFYLILLIRTVYTFLAPVLSFCQGSS